MATWIDRLKSNPFRNSSESGYFCASRVSLVQKIKASIKAVADVVYCSARRFDSERGFEAAAALAFYSVVSLFPLLLLLIAGMSLIIEGQGLRDRMLATLFDVVPHISRNLIESNLEQVLQAREGFSIVAILTLIWTASSVFNGLVQNLNRAWMDHKSLTIIKNRLLAIATVFGLFTFLMLLLIIQHAVKAIEKWKWASSPMVAVLIPSSTFLAYAFGFLSILTLYKLVPACKVRWRDAAIGAVSSIVIANLVTTLYGFYLSAQLEQYNLIYGSLATVLGFMFWTYAMHVIVLFGAHLSAQIEKVNN